MKLSFNFLLFKEFIVLRKRNFVYILLPLLIISLVFQSTLYFGNNIEKSLRPPAEQSNQYLESPVHLKITGQVPISLFVNSLDTLTPFFSNLINSSLLNANFDPNFIETDYILPIISVRFNFSNNPIYIIGSDIIFQMLLSNLINNSLVNYKQSSLITIVNNYQVFNSSNIPGYFSFNQSNTSIKNLGVVDFNSVLPYFPQISYILNFANPSVFSFVNQKTFEQIVNDISISQFEIDILLQFKINDLYHMVYYSKYQGDFPKLYNFITVNGENFGIALSVDPILGLDSISYNFFQNVSLAQLIWYLVSIFLLFLSLVLLKFCISNSFYFFRRSYDLMKLKGITLSFFLSYFLFEIIIIFFIQIPISELIIWIFSGVYSPFGITNSFLSVSDLADQLKIAFNSLIILFIGVVFLYLYYFVRFQIDSSFISDIANLNPNSKRKLPKYGLNQRLFLEIAFLIIGILFYWFSSTIILKLASLSLLVLVLIIVIPEFVNISYYYYYYLIKIFSVKFNINFYGIKSIILKLRIKRLNKRIQTLLIFITFSIIFLTFFSTYQMNLNLSNNYNNGSELVYESNIINNTLLQSFKNINDGSGVSLTIFSPNDDLGSKDTIFPQNFNVYAIDPLTYPSLNNLNNPGFYLSDSIENLMNKLSKNNTVLVAQEFLTYRHLKIGDNFTIYTSNNVSNSIISLNIVGSFKLWPGFIHLPFDPSFAKSAILMSLSSFYNLPKSELLTFFYNINPSINFNYQTYYANIINYQGITIYDQNKINDIFNQLTYSPLIYTISIFFVILFVKSLYEADKNSSEIIEDFTVLKGIGLSNSDYIEILFFEIIISVFIIAIGALLGIYFGFLFLKDLNIFNSFPLIQNLNFGITFSLILIVFILSALELIFGKVKADHINIVEILSIED